MSADLIPVDPVREVFGGKPLPSMSAEELRAGAVKLGERQRTEQQRLEQEKLAFKRGMLDGSVDFKAGPSDEWKEAEYLIQMLGVAIEAAQEAAQIAAHREEDLRAIEHLRNVEKDMLARQKVADEMDKLANQMMSKLVELDRLGGDILKSTGIRLTSSTAASMHRDQVRHVIEMAFSNNSGGVWRYDRMPPTRLPPTIGSEARNVHADILREFEERWEVRYGREIDWARSS